MSASSPMVEDDDDALAEAAKLVHAHTRATNGEQLNRVLVRSKRGGQHMNPAERGRAVQVVMESASKTSKLR